MKGLRQIVISIVVAVSVFFTGIGVIIVNCNCASCDKQSVLMVNQDVCISAQYHQEENKSCCSTQKPDVSGNCSDSSFNKDKSHCSASRLSIDIDASTFRSHVSSPVIWLTDALFVLPVNVFSNEGEQIINYTHLKSPPDIPPREYLSFLRILII